LSTAKREMLATVRHQLEQTPEGKFALRRKAFRYDPNGFAREVLRIKPDPWQLDANEAIADYVRWSWGKPMKVQKLGPNGEPKNFFTVSAMHGPGKTFWGGQVIHWFGFCMPEKPRIPCFAPKMEQLTTRLWPELRKIRNSADPVYHAFNDITATACIWAGDIDWVARAYTASSPENLAGLHHSVQLAFCDEATGIHEQFWPVIKSALSTIGVQILILISNPTKNVGEFAASHLKPNIAKHYYQIRITLDKAPRVSSKWVQMMREALGEDSPIFKIRVLGEFAQMGDRQLFAPQWLVDARNRALADNEDGVVKFNHVIGDGSRPKIRISVDVADGGLNKTVVTCMKHFSSVRFLMKQKQYSFPTAESPLLAAKAAIDMFYQYGGTIAKGSDDDIVVDGLGVGAGAAGRVMESKIPCIVYKGGAESDNPKMWRNRRVQSFMSARNDLRDGHVVFLPECMDKGEVATDDGDFIDPWDEFDSQMCQIQTRNEESGDRLEDLMTKKEMVTNGIVSPDRADSYAMQYATQSPSFIRQDAKADPADTLKVIRSTRMDGFIG
jgi:phage terminase large subunit